LPYQLFGGFNQAEDYQIICFFYFQKIVLSENCFLVCWAARAPQWQGIIHDFFLKIRGSHAKPSLFRKGAPILGPGMQVAACYLGAF